MSRVVVCLALAILIALPVRAEISGRVSVVDGDTLDVGGTRVRLYGIDAPERDQPCQTELGTEFFCGTWVSGQVRGRFEGQHARCIPQTTDRYDRLVARCAVEGQDMGRRLVADGLAYAFRRYSMAYDPEERRAAARDAGLHALVLQRPAQHRASPPRARLPVDAVCRIKGNVSRNGRIFHLPGQQHYGNTVIDPARGERLFCSEAEARAAGWRPARR